LADALPGEVLVATHLTLIDKDSPQSARMQGVIEPQQLTLHPRSPKHPSSLPPREMARFACVLIE
jgi:hypothetical protein